MMIKNYCSDTLFEFDPLTNALFCKKTQLHSEKKFRIGIIIDTAINFPPKTGCTYRLYHLSQHLAQLGHPQVWFIANRNYNHEIDLKELKNNGITIHLLPPHLFYDPDYLSHLLKEEEIDILQFEITQTVNKLGIPLLQKNPLPIVVECHDIEATLQEGFVPDADFQYLKTIQYIAATIADATICMTPTDKASLLAMRIAPEKIFLIPNGVEAVPYGKELQDDGQTLIFLGNLFYPPNQQALEILLDEVLPILLQRLPDIKLKAIGMVPQHLLIKYQNRRYVSFSGAVDNIYEELSKGTIGLCTVLSGSGMKVKVLDYCFTGLPVIVTPLGDSGFEQINSLVRVKPIPADIAKAIEDLFQDSIKRKKLGQENQKSVCEHYSWDALSKRMIEAYNFAYSSFHGESTLLEYQDPIWFQEGRHQTEVLQQHYVINQSICVNCHQNN